MSNNYLQRIKTISRRPEKPCTKGQQWQSGANRSDDSDDSISSTQSSSSSSKK